MRQMSTRSFFSSLDASSGKMLSKWQKVFCKRKKRDVWMKYDLDLLDEEWILWKASFLSLFDDLYFLCKVTNEVQVWKRKEITIRRAKKVREKLAGSKKGFINGCATARKRGRNIFFAWNKKGNGWWHEKRYENDTAFLQPRKMIWSVGKKWGKK